MSHRVHLSIAFTRLPKSLGIVISEALIVLAGCAEEITQPATPRLTFLGIPRVTWWNHQIFHSRKPCKEKRPCKNNTVSSDILRHFFVFKCINNRCFYRHLVLNNKISLKGFPVHVHIYIRLIYLLDHVPFSIHGTIACTYTWRSHKKFNPSWEIPIPILQVKICKFCCSCVGFLNGLDGFFLAR